MPAAKEFERGKAAFARGDYALAIVALGDAIQSDAEFVAAYHARAFVYAAKGDYGKAIADYTEAIRLNPNSAESVQGPRQRLRVQGRIPKSYCRLRRGH